MSGMDFGDGNGKYCVASAKAPPNRVRAWVLEQGGRNDKAVFEKVDEISKLGGTPLVVADGPRILGTIYLKDIVKGGIKERFAQLRKMGVKTVMITGDNQLTRRRHRRRGGRG